jgi:hypothetical protein
MRDESDSSFIPHPSSLKSTPTRIRTRNASFEARYDRPFHHRGVERKARESNPHLRWENRLSRAARPTVSGYLPSVDPPGIELGFPVCRAGVVPLDHEPIPCSGPRGNRTLISGVRSRRRPIGPAAQTVIPDGLEPSLPGCGPGVVAAGPRDQTISDCRLQIADFQICNLQSKIKLRRPDSNRRRTAYETVLETRLQSTPQ